MTGERDIRSEDRQLLLDAIGAATETLVITYTGADERTGQPRPPAVPLAELLDALDQTSERRFATASSPGIRCSRSTVQRHTRGTCRARQPFTFDPTALAAAEAAAGRRCEPVRFFADPLPPSPRPM